MRLSRKSEIAIDVLICCAHRSGDLVKTHEAAAFANATALHAHQVTLQLVRAGVLASVRGKKGGIHLARPADRIRLSEVVRITQPQFTPPEIPNANATLATVMDEVLHTALDILERFTIADLAEGRPGHRVPCMNCEFRTSFLAPHRAPIAPS